MNVQDQQAERMRTGVAALLAAYQTLYREAFPGGTTALGQDLVPLGTAVVVVAASLFELYGQPVPEEIGELKEQLAELARQHLEGRRIGGLVARLVES